MITVIMWASFLLFYAGNLVGERLALLGGGLLFLVTIIAGIVLALLSSGAANGLLVAIALGLGTVVITGSIAPLKRLVRHLQV